MNKQAHTQVLSAYLARLTVKNMEVLLQASKACLQEQLNGNGSSLRNAVNNFDNTVKTIVNDMPAHDINTLNNILEQSKQS